MGLQLDLLVCRYHDGVILHNAEIRHAIFRQIRRNSSHIRLAQLREQRRVGLVLTGHHNGDNGAGRNHQDRRRQDFRPLFRACPQLLSFI